jgi:hypothetical protein
MKVYIVERPERPERWSVRLARPRLRPGWVVRRAVIRPKALAEIVKAARG